MKQLSKIGFIGGGNIAHAMIIGLLATSDLPIIVSESNKERRKFLSGATGGLPSSNVLYDNSYIFENCNPIISVSMCQPVGANGVWVDFYE